MKHLIEKEERFKKALEFFVERLKSDRLVLAAVLVGSLSQETIWHRETISIWIIETDGVTRKRKSDGENERIFRTFVEADINVHAEIIPRTRFKRMIEGSSRTAFSHSFFARRTLLFANDESIEKWFNDANQLATKDQQTSLMIATTWTIAPLKYIENLLNVKKDWEMARQELVGVAYSLAAIEIILQGKVYESEIIYKAQEYNPELFEVVYTNLLKPQKSKKKLQQALDEVNSYLDKNGKKYLKPIVQYLKKHRRLVPLSEMAEVFAHTQVYPWHIETACEWLNKKGWVEKLPTPLKLTTKSQIEIEEPAYEFQR